MGDFIIEKNGTWWLRYRLPKDVRANFGLWEILRNLGIPARGKDQKELARSRALPMVIEIRKRVGQAREANHLRDLGACYSGGEQPPIEIKPDFVIAPAALQAELAKIAGSPFGSDARGGSGGKLAVELPDDRRDLSAPATRLRAELANLAALAEERSTAARGITCGAPQSARVAFALGAPKTAPGAVPTFREAADAFLAAQPALIRKGERTQKRLDWYTGRLNRHICPPLGDRSVSDVDTAACDEMFEQRSKLGASVESHAQDVQLIRQVLEFARDDMRVTAPIRLPKRVSRPQTRHATITPEQFTALVEHLQRGDDQFLFAMVVLMGLTGMRPGEAREVEFRDFGAYRSGGDPSFLRVPDGKVGRRDFHVIDDDGTLADVVKLLRDIHPTPADPAAKMFQAEEYHRAFHDVLIELDRAEPGQGWLEDDEGNHVVLYSLRHMFITGALLDGHNIDDVAMMCGTSAAQIRQHYSHVTPKQMWDRVRHAERSKPSETSPRYRTKTLAGSDLR